MNEKILTLAYYLADFRRQKEKSSPLVMLWPSKSKLLGTLWYNKKCELL